MSTNLQPSQINIPTGFIDLGIGDPDFSLLPLALLRRSAKKRLAQTDSHFLQYGLEQGDPALRHPLAGFLSHSYGFPVQPENLFITSGISGGLDLICSLYTHTGDTIFVEEPSYFLALQIFRDHYLKIEPIPTDSDGLVIEALEKKLAEVIPAFIYIIPTYQNPTGQTLSPARREKLIALSRERRLLVLADEVYHLLSYRGDPPRPLSSDPEARDVLSLGSFSKILAPGLRLGWIQAHTDHIRRLASSGLLESGGGMNPFTSAIVGEVVTNGALEKNLAHLKATYGARVEAMAQHLKSHLPELAYDIPQGGYFFWVRFPGGVDAEALLRLAEPYQVSFRPGPRFSSRGGMRDYARLSFSFYEPAETEEGLIRLRSCLENLRGVA